MTKEEMKNKYAVRAKIFQQAMESCKSSSPMDCIEWFADRITDLEKENAELKDKLNNLASVAEVRLANWQKYSKKLKEAKELIRQLCSMVRELNKPNVQLTNVDYSLAEAEQFISEVEK